VQVVKDLSSRFVRVPPGPWPDPPQHAAIVPIRSHAARQTAGFLIAGLSSRLQFDEGYQKFLELAATQIGNAIANAHVYEEERKRAEALAEIDREKTAFLSKLSHEFRTLMLGPLEDALSNSLGILPTGAAAGLAVSHRNALRLLKLVNTMLDFSRIEAGLDPDRIGAAHGGESNSVTPAAFVEEASRWLPDEAQRDGQDADRPDVGACPDWPAVGAQQLKEQPRIVWADDNADMRAYVRRLLGDRFDVAAVPDGEAALEAARARKPDLVVSDVMMPKLDGFGLIRELRADPQLSEVPVILLSARAGEEARIEAMEAKADDYLIKPFSARELHALVDSHLKMSRFRREAIEAARRAERNASLLASIVESSDDAIVSKNLEGIIMSWNQGAERLFGYTAAEVIGKSINILIPPEHVDEEPRILARLRRGERVDHFETIRVRKDGSRLNISLTISPVKDPQGMVVGASKIARDITERFRQERALQVANAALHQANADLQLFAYSASHDLQEPLRALRVYSELLQQRFGGQLGQVGDEFIRHTVEGATRMDDLLRGLRTYMEVSATYNPPLEEINAGEVLNKTLLNLQAAIEESCASITTTALPRVRMHEFQLEQLFQNLIGNAIRYRNGVPRIKIAAALQDRNWLFSVKDNGIGIEPQFKEQIFGIFKRLHTASQHPGTGMGLAICQRIVERAGGRIWVESEPEKGSTFYFTIPAAGSSETTPQA
jgi:PAS domain S-box-containing protein